MAVMLNVNFRAAIPYWVTAEPEEEKELILKNLYRLSEYNMVLESENWRKSELGELQKEVAEKLSEMSGINHRKVRIVSVSPHHP